MSKRMELTDVQAGRGWDSNLTSTDRVRLTAMPSWLKAERFAYADLSPSQARALAVDLLVAAQAIDGAA